MNAQISPKDWQLLSEYIDGQLSSRDRSKLELRIQSRPELRDGLEELRRLRSVLRTVPRRKVPHNFTLTRAMVEKPATSRWTSWIPALSFSSAIATFLLIVTIMTGLPGTMPASLEDPNPAAGEVMMAEPEAVELAQDAEEAPPIIVWGPSSGAQGMGGMGGGGSDAARSMEGLGGGGAPEMELMAPPAGEAPIEQPVEEPAMAAPMAEEPSVSAAAEEMADKNMESLDGTGPILGVAPAEEQGTMQLKNVAPDEVQMQQEQQRTDRPVSPWLFLQIGLVLFAVGTGITAFYLKRKSKA